VNKSLGWQSEMSGFFAVREIKSLLMPSALGLVTTAVPAPQMRAFANGDCLIG